MVDPLVLSRRATNWDMPQPVGPAMMQVKGCLNLGSDIASSRLTTLIYIFLLFSSSSICQTAIPDNVPVLFYSRLWSFSSSTLMNSSVLNTFCSSASAKLPWISSYFKSLSLYAAKFSLLYRWLTYNTSWIHFWRNPLRNVLALRVMQNLSPTLNRNRILFSGRGRHRSVWQSRCTWCLLRFKREPNRAGHRVGCRCNFSPGRARRPGTCRCRWIPCNDTSRYWTCRWRIRRKRLCDRWDVRSGQHRSLIKISWRVCWRNRFLCPFTGVEAFGLKWWIGGRNDVLSRLVFQRNHPYVPGKRVDDD